MAILGHIVTTDGVKPNPEKIEAIMQFPIPKQQTKFLGVLGYYCKYIKDFGKITKPFKETNCKNFNKKGMLENLYNIINFMEVIIPGLALST